MNDLGSLIYDTRQMQEAHKMQVGLIIGKVNNIYDEKFPDKLEVEIPIGGTEKTMMVWAKFMNQMAGETWGGYGKPEVGDYVVIGFLGGNMMRPIVLGSVYQTTATMVTECANEQNSIKKFKTKQGAEVSFEVVDEKEKVILQTKNKSQIVIDEAKDEISIIGSSGKNLMTINSESGKITVTAEEEIDLAAGSTKVAMKKDGSMDIECKKLNIKNKPEVKIDANKITTEAMQINMKGSTGVKVESSAMLEVKGNIVKIN